MVVIKQKLQREEDICVVLQRKGKTIKSAPYPQYIVRRAHWVYGIPKVMLEFVKIQFAKTNPELSEIGKTYWVMNANDRF